MVRTKQYIQVQVEGGGTMEVLGPTQRLPCGHDGPSIPYGSKGRFRCPLNGCGHGPFSASEIEAYELESD